MNQCQQWRGCLQPPFLWCHRLTATVTSLQCYINKTLAPLEESPSPNSGLYWIAWNYASFNSNYYYFMKTTHIKAPKLRTWAPKVIARSIPWQFHYGHTATRYFVSLLLISQQNIFNKSCRECFFYFLVVENTLIVCEFFVGLRGKNQFFMPICQILLLEYTYMLSASLLSNV